MPILIQHTFFKCFFMWLFRWHKSKIKIVKIESGISARGSMSLGTTYLCGTYHMGLCISNIQNPFNDKRFGNYYQHPGKNVQFDITSTCGATTTKGPKILPNDTRGFFRALVSPFLWCKPTLQLMMDTYHLTIKKSYCFMIMAHAWSSPKRFYVIGC